LRSVGKGAGQAIGVTKGGRNSKIHVVVDDKCRIGAHARQYLISSVTELVADEDITPMLFEPSSKKQIRKVIPGQSNRKKRVRHAKDAYNGRNLVERFFGKTRDEATRIMLHVHRRGVGICGVFTYEVAESKVTQVMDFARQHQHPLQCTLEKE